MTGDETRRQCLDHMHAALPALFRSLLELAAAEDRTTRGGARLQLAGSYSRLVDCAGDTRFSQADRASFAELADRVAAGEFGRSSDKKQRKLRRTLKNTLRL